MDAKDENLSDSERSGHSTGSRPRRSQPTKGVCFVSDSSHEKTIAAPGWHVDRSQYFRKPQALSANASCDVAIIGGGIVGMALAYYLAPRRRVILLESSEIGSGSSGWNA